MFLRGFLFVMAVSVDVNASVSAGLLEKIANTTAVVGVFGLGYVGLPFAVEKAKVGFRVIGFDRSQSRVDQVNRGESYILDVETEELKGLVQKGLIQATTSLDLLRDVDVIIIAVPTPLTKNLTPDLQYVEAVTKAVTPYLRKGQLVCLESTTYPGTTDEVMKPILDTSGLKVEEDYFLAHSPERVDPGNQRYSTKNTNKVVGGHGPHSLEVAVAFYQRTIDHVVPVSSASAAEMVKVFENTFRAVNIALVNELALLCDRMGLDVWEVLGAAHTKPFGIMPFFPGPGVGGHCIPLDPHYLEWKAREYNFVTRFIALAGEINRSMPQFVVTKTQRVLNEAGKPLRGSKILLLGVTYKKDISDWRESPAIEVFEGLEREGAVVYYHDPFCPEIEIHGKAHHSVELDAASVADVDLVMVTTDHTTTDYTMVVDSAKLVFDTRNATKHVPGARERVVRL